MRDCDNINETQISLTKISKGLLNSPYNTENKQAIGKRKKNKLLIRKIIGYVMLFIVIIITVLSSIWIKKIGDDIKPFCLTYINYSFLTILIGVSYIKNRIIDCSKKKMRENENDVRQIEEQTSAETFSDTFEKILIDNKHNYENKFHKISVSLMALWYFGNAFYNYGLTLTSITSANSLSNLAIIFILLEKILIFKSKCSKYKILGTIFCVAGVILMAFFESSLRQDKNRNFVGDCLIIVGAFIYSIYANLLSYYSKKHKHHFDMLEVFGYMGFYTMILIPFLLILLNMFGIEKSETPSYSTIFYVFVNAVIAGMISDLLQSYSITYLSPHVVSFGMTLTIPLSYFYDFYQGNIYINWFYVGGSVLIVAAFVLIFVENYKKFKKKRDMPIIVDNTNND